MSKTYRFFVPGISCVSCQREIENSLFDYQTTPDKLFHLERDELVIDPVDRTLVLTIEQDEFSAQEIQDILNQVLPPRLQVSLIESSKNHWFWGALGSSLGFLLLLLTAMVGQWSFMVAVPIALASLVLTFVLGRYSFEQALRQFYKDRTLSMDTLFLVSSTIAFTASIVALFVPGWPMMFDVGLLMFGFRHLGLGIEQKLNEAMGAKKSFKDLIATTESYRVEQQADRALSTQRHDLKVNDILWVQPGQWIPVDGVALEFCLIQEEIVTGSPLSRACQKGQPLLAGMRLPPDQPPLRMQALKLAVHSYPERLHDVILRAKSKRTSTQSRLEFYAQYFVRGIFLIALVSALIVGYFAGTACAVQCLVAVLASACPCTWGMIAPLGMRIGIHKARDAGVVFKSTQKLEIAANINCVVFDMTGTLTFGQPSLQSENIYCCGELNEQQMLSVMYALEKTAPHHFAQAICAYAESQVALKWSVPVVQQVKQHASGLSGRVDGIGYRVGDAQMMKEHGIDVRAIEQKMSLSAEDRVIYLADQNKVLGYVILKDRLRPEAFSVIQALKAQQIKVCLCTGSDETSAARCADVLGIDEIRAQCVPEKTALYPERQTKVAYIEQLKQQGYCVAMIGDGLNDALGLAASDVGMAMYSPNNHELLQEQAHIVSTQPSLKTVLMAIEIPKQTMAHVEQNIFLNLTYNTVMIGLASGILLTFGMMLSPSLGAALMVLQSSLSLVNAYRFQRQTMPYADFLSHDSATNDEVHYPRMLKALSATNDISALEHASEPVQPSAPASQLLPTETALAQNEPLNEQWSSSRFQPV